MSSFRAERRRALPAPGCHRFREIASESARVRDRRSKRICDTWNERCQESDDERLLKRGVMRPCIVSNLTTPSPDDSLLLMAANRSPTGALAGQGDAAQVHRRPRGENPKGAVRVPRYHHAIAQTLAGLSLRFEETKSDTLNLRVSPSFKLALKAAADHEQRSMVNMLEVLVASYCDKNGISVTSKQPRHRAANKPHVKVAA